MNVAFPVALTNRVMDLDLRKNEGATGERLESSVRVGRRAGGDHFLGEVRLFPHGIMDRAYRDALRTWYEDVSLMGNYTEVPLAKAKYATVVSTKQGTTAWDSQRGAFVITLTANSTDMAKDVYVSILYNGTPRVFKVQESITARRKVLWPNVHVGSGVIVHPLSSFRCYALKEDVDVFIGAGPYLSDEYGLILYEYVG